MAVQAPIMIEAADVAFHLQGAAADYPFLLIRWST